MFSRYWVDDDDDLFSLHSHCCTNVCHFSSHGWILYLKLSKAGVSCGLALISKKEKKKKNLLWMIAGLFICLVLFIPKEKNDFKKNLLKINFPILF